MVRAKGIIAYSLGNFVSDQYDDRTRNGLVLRLLVDRIGLRAAETLQVETGLRPKWVSSNNPATGEEAVQTIHQKLAYSCGRDTCQAEEAPGYWSNGKFSSGRIDLTGDGIDEIIRLEDGEALVYEGDEIVWRSPKEWDVRDIALGDPNLDGRAEAALALQKKDASGSEKSHPFLVGYRSGRYRLVWGGSAVAYPILEIELADIDGDNNEEMIVLEERSKFEQAVTIWRWNDWVFSQVWSTPVGHYMRLKTTETREKSILILIEKIW